MLPGPAVRLLRLKHGVRLVFASRSLLSALTSPSVHADALAKWSPFPELTTGSGVTMRSIGGEFRVPVPSSAPSRLLRCLASVEATLEFRASHQS